MKKYIIITTIQGPTEATLKFSKKKEWTLVVVGDKKTPHEEYGKIDCVYLHPDEQQKLYPKLSSLIGWNTIQRRNIGFLYAYHQGADIVATVDDDNIPYESWGEDLLVGKEVEVDTYESQNGIFDPLSVTNTPDLWHRGYPLQKVSSKNNISYLGKQKRKVLVQADLWDGDPDVDAVCRITKNPIVKYDITSPFGSAQISPFNSQNTFLHREVLPYYMVLPFVGRMDDIWGAYLLLEKFPECVVYNKASVYQDRNEQDLSRNLEAEVIGYKHTLDFLQRKKTLEQISSQAFEAYSQYLEEYK